ncbi:DNA-binding transcriptional MerR regulator [Clostridium algifaecis]|uniref:DNA-binding transcriptional MerR regulator n=1 Tax=Clostridium algifaecis TaxID=1472040 RepID=A0ABS4KVK4_9CLOT|nr:MerR family transcriptional regulator [Clostridium algifaecis]MBP2034047.1 DNA-binding transcriptional MerR regulator [Clostridium algifaecis]
MGYNIAQAAERIGVTTYTLRYYDKEGLLPFVERNAQGNRDFKESDFEWLEVITCLKSSGMPIKKIKDFIDWCVQGDDTLEKRLNVFLEHKKVVEAKLIELQKYMDKINYKIRYYETAIEAGTEAIHKGKSCSPIID